MTEVASHEPVGVTPTEVGWFVRCACGKNPTPKHWIEDHWPGDRTEGESQVHGLIETHRGGILARESGSTDMDIPAEAVEAATQAILDEGGAPGHSIHSWRCEHPDRYGDCDCVQVTAQIALAAAFPHLRPLFQHAAEVGRELGRREAEGMVVTWIAAQRLAEEVASPAPGASSEPLTGSGVGTGDTEGTKALQDPPGPGSGHRRCDCARMHPIDICAECGDDWPCKEAK